MISFVLGRGAVAVEGTYSPQTGIVVSTQRPAIADLAVTLQSEIDYGMATSPHAVTGRYAMAIWVLRQWGADVDISNLPKYDPNVAY